MMKDITNPMEYIECVIAFDCLDWATDERHAVIYAIVLGWDDENYTDLQNIYNWSDEYVRRLKKFHKEWTRICEEVDGVIDRAPTVNTAQVMIYCKDCRVYDRCLMCRSNGYDQYGFCKWAVLKGEEK